MRYGWFQLIFCYGLATEWVYASDTECHLDRVFIKCLDVSSPEQVGKVSFRDVSSMFLLKLINLFSPAFFHFTEADDIKTLEGMSAVGRIPKDNDVVLACIVEELGSVM
jgi:hypothetical protein